MGKCQFSCNCNIYRKDQMISGARTRKMGQKCLTEFYMQNDQAQKLQLDWTLLRTNIDLQLSDTRCLRVTTTEESTERKEKFEEGYFHMKWETVNPEIRDLMRLCLHIWSSIIQYKQELQGCSEIGEFTARKSWSTLLGLRDLANYRWRGSVVIPSKRILLGKNCMRRVKEQCWYKS